MLERFKKYMIDNKLSENTYNSYWLDANKYMNYYYDSYGETLVKLNSSDVQIYKSYFKNNINQKPTTINRNLNDLKNIMSF